MIDGLKVRMTTDELAARLTERIEWHKELAEEYEAELRMTPDRREDPLMPDHMIEHEMRQHEEEAASLTMLRDHLVPDETYELGEMDLRFADLVPEFHMEYSVPRRRSSEAGKPGAEALLEP